MSGLHTLFNRLLPFATPGTPLIQDLLHLAVLCVALYFAPQLQERLARGASQGAPHEDAHQEPLLSHLQPHDHGPVDDHEEVPPNLPAQVDQEPGPALIDGADRDIVEEAGPAQPRAVHDQRNVGAKKAKALARKDQRRAYNEFQRAQGDAQRAKDAEGAAEREQALAVERERRKAAESAYEAKRAKERQERKQQEESARQEEIRRRELAVRLVREELNARKCCDLFQVAQQIGKDVDEEEIEQVLKGTGLLGREDNTLTFITQTGWAVRVSITDMAVVYKRAVEMDSLDESGIVQPDTLGQLLEEQIKS